MIRHPDALHPDNVMAYDNAVSALGKICQFHRDGIDAAKVALCALLFLSYIVVSYNLLKAYILHKRYW